MKILGSITILSIIAIAVVNINIVMGDNLDDNFVKLVSAKSLVTLAQGESNSPHSRGPTQTVSVQCVKYTSTTTTSNNSTNSGYNVGGGVNVGNGTIGGNASGNYNNGSQSGSGTSTTSTTTATYTADKILCQNQNYVTICNPFYPCD